MRSRRPALLWYLRGIVVPTSRKLRFPSCGWVAGGLLALMLLGAAVPASAQPSELVSRMAAKEAAARSEGFLFSYTNEERSMRTGGHLWREKVVETQDGVLRRLLAVDGVALSERAAEAESRRIDEVVANPEEFRKMNSSVRDDEVHAVHLLQLMPKAFLLSADGEEDGCTRIAFRPNPAFEPSTYEERVVQVLAGTVSVAEPADRLCHLQAHFTRPVEFGFGLLGRLDSDGSFDLTRRKVDPARWKSADIRVHIQGRVLLLKSLSKEQDARRTDIRAISKEISLAEAARLSRP